MHDAQTCNLARLLSDTARLWPDRTALIQGEQRWTWAQIDARVDALVAALRSLGLKKGDRILLQSRNNLAMFESGKKRWQGSLFLEADLNFVSLDVDVRRVIDELSEERGRGKLRVAW